MIDCRNPEGRVAGGWNGMQFDTARSGGVKLMKDLTWQVGDLVRVVRIGWTPDDADDEVLAGLVGTSGVVAQVRKAERTANQMVRLVGVDRWLFADEIEPV